MSVAVYSKSQVRVTFKASILGVIKTIDLDPNCKIVVDELNPQIEMLERIKSVIVLKVSDPIKEVVKPIEVVESFEDTAGNEVSEEKVRINKKIK